MNSKDDTIKELILNELEECGYQGEVNNDPENLINLIAEEE